MYFALIFSVLIVFLFLSMCSYSASESSRKVALVTGASRGIGLSLTKELLKEGLQVIAVARNVETLSELNQQFPNQLQVISADLSTKGGQLSVAPAVSAIKVDYLVHNAAIIEPLGKNALLEVPPEDIQKILEVNVIAPIITKVNPQLCWGD